MKKKLLQLSSIAFLLLIAGQAMAQNPIPNYDFETWESDTLHQFSSFFMYNHPSEWSPLACGYYWGFSAINGPISCYQSTDKYTGNYSLNVTVENDSVGADMETYFPIGYRPQYLTGYYKFTGVPGDTSNIYVAIIKGNSLSWSFGDTSAVELGSASLLLTGSSVPTFQPFSIPIVYKPGSDMPGSAMMMITSTVNIGVSKPGQKLWVDNLAFAGTVGIDEESSDKNIRVYPNPARDYVIVDVRNNIYLNSDLEILDMTGRTVMTGKIERSNNRIKLSSLENGIYMMQIRNSDKAFSKKIIKY